MPALKGSTPWNAGKGKGWTDQRGYVWVYVIEGGKRRARRLHRVVMERHIGRRLEPWEVVHHKDENPQNNAIENLEIREFGEHTAHHHLGARRSRDARRSMEAFALLREELKHVRRVNSELLDVCSSFLARYDNHMVSADLLFSDVADKARAAIAKALGESQ